MTPAGGRRGGAGKKGGQPGTPGGTPAAQDAAITARANAEASMAIEAVRRDDRRRAEQHVTRAVTLLEEIEAEPLRRKEYALLAMLLVDLGFHERGLDLATRAIQLDHKLGYVDLLAEDMLSYGNALSRLDRIPEAVEVFEQVRDLCLARGRFGNAASASTNIAIEHLKEDRLPEARAGLEDSLRLLARDDFPDTEIRTRMALVHVRNAQGEPPQPLLEEVVAVLDKFGAALTPDHRQLCKATVEDPLRRYRAQARSPDEEAWIVALARRLQAL